MHHIQQNCSALGVCPAHTPHPSIVPNNLVLRPPLSQARMTFMPITQRLTVPAICQVTYSQASMRTEGQDAASISRRAALLSTIAASSALLVLPSQASLVQFPASQLQNKYILVRAGESYEDVNGRVARNPVWKTSQTSGLTKRGIKQVLSQTVPVVKALGIAEDLAWIWPSIWQSSYMTAEILAYELNLGRSQIVPEYSFLDMRGLGAYEGGDAALVAQQVSDFDAQDFLWRPPKGEDGTPHESLEEVLVRVRQLMSICETQYRGDNIIIVAPDSDVLSVLQAATLGVDLRQHTRFTLPLGGVRELALAPEPYDSSPMQFSCPSPPSCRAQDRLV